MPRTGYDLKVFERFKKLLDKYGVILKSPYGGTQEKCLLTCKHGHTWKNRPNDLFSKERRGRVFNLCPVCSRMVYTQILQSKKKKRCFRKKHKIIKYAVDNNIPLEYRHYGKADNSHEACKVVQCYPAQNYMKEILKMYSLDYDLSILDGYVVRIEKKLFRRNMYCRKQDVCALSLYIYGLLHKRMTQVYVAKICGTSPVSIRKYLRVLKIKVEKPVVST